jgi:glycosyltransferase involved in cell wall biosynthesis
MTVPLVHVTIPTFKTPPEMLRRAVLSVLEQTHRDLRLIVVCDGEPIHRAQEALVGLSDARMNLLSHEVNQGRYACDHNLVRSIAQREPGQLWAPLDSDDWAELDWLEKLLAWKDAADADVAFCNHRIHRSSRAGQRIEVAKPWDGTDRLAWHAHLSGLWSVDFVVRWGLTNPRWRIGWDTIMTSAPWVLGRATICPLPLVNRTVRPNSLTTARATRFGSPARAEARRRCQQVWSEIVANPNLASEILDNA